MPDAVDIACLLGVGTVLIGYIVMLCMAVRRMLRLSRMRYLAGQVHPSELCYACCDNMANVTLLYCGHGGLCHECARKVLTEDRRCPLCRQSSCGVLLLAPLDGLEHAHIQPLS